MCVRACVLRACVRVCVCVCACVRACVLRACVCVCVCVTRYGKRVLPPVLTAEAGTDRELPGLVLTLLVIVKVEYALKRGLWTKDEDIGSDGRIGHNTTAAAVSAKWLS